MMVVEKRIYWASIAMGDIVPGSLAGKSCRVVGQDGAFPTTPSKKKVTRKTTSGGDMGHRGQRV